MRSTGRKPGKKIVHYADKICEGSRIVEWSEHLAGLTTRYPTQNADLEKRLHPGSAGPASRIGRRRRGPRQNWLRACARPTTAERG